MIFIDCGVCVSLSQQLLSTKMPLLINDLVYDSNHFRNFYNIYPQLKETCRDQFLNKTVRLIDSPKFLFVSQGEYCIVNRADDNVDIVGSDEATTCCVMFLHTDSVVAVAHLDNAIKFDTIKRFVAEVLDSNSQNSEMECDRPARISCRLVGSYRDEQYYSSKLIQTLLHYLNHIPNVRIDLEFACILEMNTKLVHKNGKQYNSPLFYGAAVDLGGVHRMSTDTSSDTVRNLLSLEQSENTTSEYDLFPAEFKDRGPEIVLRRARRWFQEKDLVSIYNSKTKLFIIDEFNYFTFEGINQFIDASDQQILDQFSTSPLVEPAHFAESIRQIFRLIQCNRIREPVHRFRRHSTGEWIDEIV